MRPLTPPVRVMHFARVVNRHDFIDTVVRFADPDRFRMLVAVLSAESNIEAPDYAASGVERFVLPARSRRGYALLILGLARLLRRERVALLHTHHYDEAFVGALAARLARVPMVLGRHYHDELYLTATGSRLRALLAVEGLANRLARLVVVPSTAIRALLTERQGVPARKVRVIPYGFDFGAARYRRPEPAEVAAVRRELGLEGAFVVGNVGRHHALKGQAYLLRGFAELARERPEARLLMVGDGPESGALRRLAAALGIDARTRFTGWRRDAPRLLGAVDVLVHPTLHEAFSQLMVEALALARPLVITDVSGAADCVDDGRTGLIVPRRDPVAIREALRWVAGHPAEARAMGEAGSRRVREALDIRAVVPRHEAAYGEILGAGDEGGGGRGPFPP